MSDRINKSCSNYDALILCGGLGTRLSTVTKGGQKVLVKIGVDSFLSLLIKHLRNFSFSRIIFCAGHYGFKLQEEIVSEFGKMPNFFFSIEPDRLGTGGAIKYASNLIQTKTFIVFNGDSICDFDYYKMLRFHKEKGGICSIALVKGDRNYAGGFVKINEDESISGFKEKEFEEGYNYINAGIYVFEKEILNKIPSEQKISLEKEIFPKLCSDNIFGYKTNAELYDIGTPERLERFLNVWRKNVK